MRFYSLTAMILCAGAAIAQQPAEEADPSGPHGRPILDAIGQCDITESSIDITTPTGDIRILGCAHAENVGKWFFSGANAGVPRIYVMDDDAYGRPDTATVRSFPWQGTAAYWGARDMAWEPVSGMVYHGDENSHIYQIDPTSETYTGNFWGLAGSASGTVRALAVKNEPNGTYGANTLRVIQSNWNNPVEQWDLDLTNSANATNTGMSFPNPGSLYGASYVKNGTVLALFGQTQHPCTGTGLIRVTFVDELSLSIIWERAGDFSLPGTAPNTAGGLAGGCEVTTVSGQPVVAAVQQTTSDSLAFVPFTGFAFLDDASGCGGSRLIPQGNAELGNTSFGLKVMAGPANGGSVIFANLPPRAGLPLTGGCTLDASLLGALFFVVPLNGNGEGATAVPLPGLGIFDGVQLILDTIDFDLTGGGVSSSQTMELTLSSSMI